MRQNVFVNPAGGAHSAPRPLSGFGEGKGVGKGGEERP